MELNEIVMRLVGPVHAIGEHNADQKRLANLKVLTSLIVSLMEEVEEAAKTADRPEASMKAIGNHARAFLFEALGK